MDGLERGDEPLSAPPLITARPNVRGCYRMLADFREDMARNAEASAWYYESIGDNHEAAHHRHIAAHWRKLAAFARRRAA